MTDDTLNPEGPEWPREIWMAEREEYDQGVVTAVLSEWATVARWEGDLERDREFHRYVDADIYDSAEKYWQARSEAYEAEMKRLRARAEAAEAREARLREASTPSGDTKAAYMGEVECDCPTETWRHHVPWTAIKAIMAMIRARAALTEEGRDYG